MVFDILSRVKLSFSHFCAGGCAGDCRSFKPPFYFSAFQFHTSSASLSSGQKSSVTEDSWVDIADGQLMRWALMSDVTKLVLNFYKLNFLLLFTCA